MSTESMLRESVGWRVYLESGAIRMAFFGFSSGLPLLLVLGTLGFWLREAGVDLKTIGFMSWIGLIYGLKWSWAPLVDRLPIPILTHWLGQRRSWLLVAQLGVMLGLFATAFADPQINLGILAVSTVGTAFASATQDIALDAYRIESADSRRQAAYAAMYQAGYRMGMIWAGAGALAFAAWAAGDTSGYLHSAWGVSYSVMAMSMSVGIVTTLFAPEPSTTEQRGQTAKKKPFLQRTKAAIVEPFTLFFHRFGWSALLVLVLIATYRISDVVMGIMANPFYQDIGFTKEQVAAVSKVFGVVMTLLGAFIGGAATMRYGVLKMLMLGAVLSAATNVLFSMLAQIGASLTLLIAAVSADNLAGGLASAAFVAYLSLDITIDELLTGEVPAQIQQSVSAAEARRAQGRYQVAKIVAGALLVAGSVIGLITEVRLFWVKPFYMFIEIYLLVLAFVLVVVGAMVFLIGMVRYRTEMQHLNTANRVEALAALAGAGLFPLFTVLRFLHAYTRPGMAVFIVLLAVAVGLWVWRLAVHKDVPSVKSLCFWRGGIQGP